MATIRGQRDLKNVTQDNLAREIRKSIIEIQSNRAPFISFLMALPSKASKQMKFEYFQHDQTPAVVAADGGHTDADTTIQLHSGQAAFLKVNTQLFNFRTEEVMRITIVDTSTDIVTVVRGAASSVAAAINDNDVLGIASEAHEEGVAFADAITNESDLFYNYLQEFETAIDMSWLKMASEELTEADWPFQVKNKVGEHKEKMERAFLFGKRDLIASGPNGKRVYYTGGLYQYVKGNADASRFVDLSGGLLTKTKLDAFLAPIYSYGNPNRKVIITSPLGWTTISNLADGYQTIQRSEKTLGMSIQKVEINGHLYSLVEDQTLVRLQQEDILFVVDMDHVQKRYLAANGKNFQTTWFKDVQDRDIKGKKDVLYGVEGMEVSNANAHGIMKNFKLVGE